MSAFTIRRMRQPDDYEAVAGLLNQFWPEPTTAKRLEEDEAKIPPGKLGKDERNKLTGWDRPKWVAEEEEGRVVGYAIAWRAPWTEPGMLILTVVVDAAHRGKGIGTALYAELLQWAQEIGASKLELSVHENDEASVSFAIRRGFAQERHVFQSVLELAAFEDGPLFATIDNAEQAGIRFTTLAEEPGEASERRLHELYKTTAPDIPGYTGDYPWFEEWKKWTIGLPGVRPAFVHIAKDGDRYVGVVTLQQNEQTGAMYHEYTCVLPAYRGRHLALALKLLGIRTARACGVPYLRTHNDSLNGPMLHINRDLLGFRAEPGDYRMVREL